MDVPYGPVCHMGENYVDGYGKLPEDQEGDSNVGIYLNKFLA